MAEHPQMAAARRKQPKQNLPAGAEDGAGNQPKDAIEVLAAMQPPSKQGTVAAMMSFKGPIPHPEIFKGYAEIIPDAPERILCVFEKDSAHARDIQAAALDAQSKDNRRTHWMAWSLVAACIGMAVVFGLRDNTALAIGFLSAPLIGAATSFLRGRSPDEGKAKAK